VFLFTFFVNGAEVEGRAKWMDQYRALFQRMYSQFFNVAS